MGPSLRQAQRSWLVLLRIYGCLISYVCTLLVGTWCLQMRRRGFPMSLYSVGIIASCGLGPTIAGWIEANPSLGWRWIQWVHVMCGIISFCLVLVLSILSVSGAYFISVLLFMRETRSAVILMRMARKRRKETGDSRFRARVEETKPSLASLVWISCTRPLCMYIHPLYAVC